VIRGQAWLDAPADLIQKAVGGLYAVLGRPGQAQKNVLHGTTLLGHPFHPAIRPESDVSRAYRAFSRPESDVSRD
jgi:hypothetical protein